MHLNAKPPIFVPSEYMEEMERLSKAALMDMVWDYAVRTAGEDQGKAAAMDEFRQTRAIIQTHRLEVRFKTAKRIAKVQS